MARIEDSMGITYRQMDHWVKERYLLPVQVTGSQRDWPELEIRVGRMMSRLVAIGITPAKAAVYARAAIVNKTPMLLEFTDEGKLRVRGPFSDAVKASLKEQQRVKDSRKYPDVKRAS